MSGNFRKKKCFDIYKETKDIGFVLLVFGAVTICAFSLQKHGSFSLVYF